MSLADLVGKIRNGKLDGRNRSILTFFVTSLSGRCIGILCQLVQVPLALHYLGKEAFGVWLTLASISYVLTFSDFGVGLGAQNQITEALGIGDDALARNVFRTALIFLSTVAMLIAGAGVPIFLLLHWGAIFKLADPVLVAALPGTMSLFLVIACLNVPLSIGRRLAYATQQAWLENFSTSAGTVLTLVAVYLGARCHFGFQTYVLATWLPSLLVLVVLLVYQWSTLPWLRAPGVWFETRTLRGMARVGLLFGVQQICTLFLFAGPPLMISTMFGAAAIAPFNLIQRIFNVFQMFQNAFLLPLWPAYADAKAKGDRTWMARTFTRSLVATVGVAVVPMIAVAFVIRPLIRLWTGGNLVSPTNGLIVSLLCWNVVVALQQPIGFFLSGVSEVNRNTIYSLLTIVTALALIMLLTPHYGVPGIIFSVVIGNGIFSMLGGAHEVLRYFRVTKIDPAGSALPLEEPTG